MANVNAPFGLRPVKHLSGASWSGLVNLYCIPSTDGSAFAIGDVVKAAAGSDAMGVPYVRKGTSGAAARGVIAGVLPVAPETSATTLLGTSLALESIVIPAIKAKDYYIWVCDDPSVVCEVQMNNGIVPLGDTVAGSMNKNADFSVVANNGYISQSVLDAASIATTSTLDLRILGLTVGIVNAGVSTTGTTGQYAVALVKFNNHELANATAGV